MDKKGMGQKQANGISKDRHLNWHGRVGLKGLFLCYMSHLLHLFLEQKDNSQLVENDLQMKYGGCYRRQVTSNQNITSPGFTVGVPQVNVPGVIVLCCTPFPPPNINLWSRNLHCSMKWSCAWLQTAGGQQHLQMGCYVAKNIHAMLVPGIVNTPLPFNSYSITTFPTVSILGHHHWPKTWGWPHIYIREWVSCSDQLHIQIFKLFHNV